MSKARELADVIGTQDTTENVLQGRKNLIINGAMQVAQRGTSEIGTSNYFLDRWKKQSSTNANVTFSQDTADTPDGFRYALKAVATGSSSFIQMGQPIEFKNMAHALGKTVTLSYWAKTNLSFYSRIRSRTDTEDATTVFTATTLSVITESASTDWKLFTHTFIVPSTTLAMSVDFNTVALVSGDYFQITGVQLEVGSVATPFEHRSYGEELALCQRYYLQYSNDSSSGDMGNLVLSACSSGANQISGTIQFPVTMRATPTASYSSSIYQAVNGVTNGNRTISSASGGKSYMTILADWTHTAGYESGQLYFASGQYVKCDAEL